MRDPIRKLNIELTHAVALAWRDPSTSVQAIGEVAATWSTFEPLVPVVQGTRFEAVRRVVAAMGLPHQNLQPNRRSFTSAAPIPRNVSA
jgi:hypothetical protein